MSVRTGFFIYALASYRKGIFVFKVLCKYYVSRFEQYKSTNDSGFHTIAQLRFSVGTEEILCNPGDSWCISGDKEHGAEALQD